MESSDNLKSPPSSSERGADQADPWIPFEDCSISFAVDTSGSTLGDTLRLEQQAVSDIWGLLTPAAKNRSRILPWNTNAEPVIGMSKLQNLRSYGGTRPTAVVKNPASRHAIRTSTLWVLLTDGKIDAAEYERFAGDLATSSLHGTACIVIVFGLTRGLPAVCDISVGVSVFAIVPDCLFLYFDKASGITYLLQCSGRFTQVLEVKGKEQPILSLKTHWIDLPQIEFKDLACISIPLPKKLTADEIALQGDLVINLEDLWSRVIKDDQTIDRIFENENNLRAIMLTAQTRGRAVDFQNWLKSYLVPGNTAFVAKIDDGGMGMTSIKAMLEEMQSGISDQRKQELQQHLTKAHAQNQAVLNQQYSRSFRKKDQRRRVLISALERSDEPVRHGSSISTIPPPDSDSGYSGFEGGVKDIVFTPPSSSSSSSHVADRASNLSQVTPLFTSNFLRYSGPDGAFNGLCPLCGNQDVTMVLFLRNQPSQVRTPGFPASKSFSRLAFPLAMGNFPETDILSSYSCCDSCSFLLSQSGQTPLGEQIVSVLPIVSYTINRQAYKKQLKTAFEDRFNEDDSLLLFVAVLVTTVERAPRTPETDTWRRGVTWLCRDFFRQIECPQTFSLRFSPPDSCTRTQKLERAITAGVQSVSQVSGWENFFRYPIKGFVTMILALDYLEVTPQIASDIKNVIWQRFLFYLTEQYHEYRAVNGAERARLAIAGLVRQPKPRGINQLTTKHHSPGSNRGLSRNMLGARRPGFRLLLELNILLTSPLLKGNDLKVWKKLKAKFDWIDTIARYALGTFVYHMTQSSTTHTLAHARFAELRKNPALRQVFLEPAHIDADLAEMLVVDLPAMDEDDAS